MTLGEIIEALRSADQSHIAPIGMGYPMSWRGVYSELAFAPAKNISVAEMLKNAESAMGKTFTGYKGGEYTMGEWTDCYLDSYGSASGDKIGPALIAYMTGATNEQA